MSRQSALARTDAKVRLEMLRWMTLARRLGGRIERETRAEAGNGLFSAASTDADASRWEQGAVVPGLEAVSIGACVNARASDLVAPAPGDLGAFLIRGVSPERIVAHYAGRSSAPSLGRDGGGRIGDLALGLVAPVTRAASSVAVAAGAAFAFKREGKGRLVLCLFHERAVARGDWHEGLNFAAVQRLPVVYVCASEARRKDRSATGPGEPRVSDRAVAYGIPGVTVDGRDVLDVHAAVADAAARARRGEGPSIIEGRVERPWPSRSAGASYDPLARFARELVGAGHATEDAIAELESAVRRRVDEAFAKAALAELPLPGECLRGVYGEAAP